MKSVERSARAHRRGRRIAGRAQNAADHDPYLRSKPSEPTVCPDCSAVFHAGRWQWAAAPANSTKELCPACRRIRDDAPAGIVTLTGPFALEHRDEIRALAEHTERAERPEHALNRIIAIRELPDGLEITTTDIHLPRRIGEAIRHAYRGDLALNYAEDEFLLRVRWTRDVE